MVKRNRPQNGSDDVVSRQGFKIAIIICSYSQGVEKYMNISREEMSDNCIKKEPSRTRHEKYNI